MLGIVKAGAILVNVNFRYVEGELRYLFENSDTALRWCTSGSTPTGSPTCFRTPPT